VTDFKNARRKHESNNLLVWHNTEHSSQSWR